MKIGLLKAFFGPIEGLWGGFGGGRWGGRSAQSEARAPDGAGRHETRHSQEVGVNIRLHYRLIPLEKTGQRNEQALLEILAEVEVFPEIWQKSTQ